MASISTFGFPGGITNAQSTSDQYRLNGEMSPDAALEQQALNRRQQIANMLLQQGLAGAGTNKGQMVGRFYVPGQSTQGLADLAKIAAGAYGTYQTDQDRAGMVDQERQATAEAVRNYTKRMEGVPEHALPEGEQGPVNPAIPATLADKRSAIVQAITSRVPGLAQMAQMDYAEMNKAPEKIDLGNKIGLLRNGEVVGELPKGASPDTQANIAQKNTELGMVPAAKQAEIDAANARQAAELTQRQEQFAGVSGNTAATLANQQQIHATPSGSAVLEDKTKRELYPIASGNALAAADAQTAVAMNAHLDRVAQMEQNKRQDEATLDLRRQQGMSDEAYKRDKAALEDKWHKTQADLEREKIQIQKSVIQQGKVPAGYERVEGGLKAIPGGPADTKLQGAFNADTAMLQNSNAGFDRLATTANEILNHPGLAGITGIRGKVPDVPGTDAANARALLNTLKSQVGFGVLQEMRNNSKTGGALGAVSDAEGKRLENNLAALDTTQGIEQFKKQLQEIVNYTDQAKGRLRETFNMKHKTGEPVPMAPSTQGPKAGTVEGGYRFKGGDPGKAESWEKVN